MSNKITINTFSCPLCGKPATIQGIPGFECSDINCEGVVSYKKAKQILAEPKPSQRKRGGIR